MWRLTNLLYLPLIFLLHGPLSTDSARLRLVNGTGRCSGRVEVYHNGEWGTVCDDNWGIREADVACREMDCGTALEPRQAADFGEGSGKIWLDDVTCKGTETFLTQCRHLGFGEHNCNHREDGGVVCSDNVRLVDGTDRCSGRLEIYRAGLWGTVSDDNWDTREAEIVCRELDCGDSATVPGLSHFGGGTLLIGYRARCAGNEMSITQCSLTEFTRGSGHGGAAAVVCSAQSQMRLVNGTSRCSGRVEVYHNAHWGIVGGNDWGIGNAEVVCRAMDCGSALRATDGQHFGQGRGQTWMDGVACLGYERSLSQCPHTFASSYWSHNENAGVICSETIRLVNGTEQCSGRVEVYQSGRWSPVCDDHWGLHEAAVVCREMECGDPITTPKSSHFGRNSGLRGYTISCVGDERSLTQCSMREFSGTSCGHVGDATVVCSGNLKLVNGFSRCDGRVEFYHDGQWGTVCGNSWSKNDAYVVCRQLRCGHYLSANPTAFFGQGSGKIWIDEIECHGYEDVITQCRQRRLGDNACNHTTDAGVICSHSLSIRMVNGTDKCSGRVEVSHAGQWGTVCDQGWTVTDADVVCKLLDCGGAVTAPGGAHFGQGTGPSWEASDSCFGSESSLRQCMLQGFNTASCGHENDAGVFCAGKLRLVDGYHNCSGRVEIYHKSQWGRVCNIEWNMQHAEVVCKQFDCGHAFKALGEAHFGRGSGPIWLSGIYCTGEERTLTQCYHREIEDRSCEGGEDASVVCFDGLPKPQILMNPESEVTWGDKVDLICTITAFSMQLQGGTFTLQQMSGSFRMEKFSFSDTAIFTIHKVEFVHEGSYQCQYGTTIQSGLVNFPDGEPVELFVTVRLEQPSIALMSPHLGVVLGPNELEIVRGQRFIITCSIHSQYTGGCFYLNSHGSSPSNPKPASGSSAFLSASYEFPTAEYEDQRDYNCVYGINISTRLFTSGASKLLKVKIKASSVPSVVSGVLCGLLLLLLLLVVSYVVRKRRAQYGRAMVRGRNRMGNAGKEDADKIDQVLDERFSNASGDMKEHGNTQREEDTGVHANDSPERDVDEDVSGRICFELEPLIHAQQK